MKEIKIRVSEDEYRELLHWKGAKSWGKRALVSARSENNPYVWLTKINNAFDELEKELPDELHGMISVQRAIIIRFLRMASTAQKEAFFAKLTKILNDDVEV